MALEPVLTGLDWPIGIEHAADGSGRLFVVQQPGQVRLIGASGDLQPEAYIDIADRVQVSYEEGLLGLAFHPRFEENGRLFLHYTSRDGRSVVSEFAADPDTPSADPSSERVLLDVPNRANNHNGGRLTFGPDGYLYLALGDDAERRNAQDLESLNGKLLRIDVDGAEPYAIPDDNPYASGGGAPEVWAYGLRNPWRFSFDGETGDLWIGDVGAGAREEIDRAPGDAAGLNYGWPIFEGTSCDGSCDATPYVAPVADYGREAGDCVVIGGFVYRGSAQPALVGSYLLADLCSGRLWTIGAERAASGSAKLVERGVAQGLSISSFGDDEAGELYAVDLSGGGLYLVTSAP
ncbi:MAG: sorbosone dehydrogenase family protein [Candidatus Limnocylindria bacterium]